MREVLYKTTQRYYDLDISFIKHQGTKNNVKRKGVFILPLAHLPRRSEKNGLCKIGGGGDKPRCIKGEVPMANRPFPSYKYSHFQNKAYCGTFLVKMSFICIRMKNKRECSSFSLDKKNHCHINGFALSLALKHRLGATRKSPKRTKNFQFTCLKRSTAL